MFEIRAAFLERAVELACLSVPAGGGPFGAVIVRNGVTLAEGSNRVTLDGDPTAHAEIVAIRAATRALGTSELHGCILYSSCEPCPMCAGAIHWARISRVVFAASRSDAARAGFDDAVLHDDLARPPDQRCVPATAMMIADAAEPFRLWGRFAARIGY